MIKCMSSEALTHKNREHSSGVATGGGGGGLDPNLH